jgi:hypothetical protein
MAGTKSVRGYFNFSLPQLEQIAQALSADPQRAIERASSRWDELSPNFAYADEPDHPMAPSFLLCAAHLVLFEVLREESGVDEHTYGRTMHSIPPSPVPEPTEPEAPPNWSAAAKESMANRRAGRFAFELVRDEAADFGMNIRACALVHEFSRHDALDLVPYFCHNDDVGSDATGQGLRRTGTIAVGASHCDFRYKAGGEPLRIIEQYPDKVRLAP